jgi:L-threonylcarbamoyladenylate synthase
MPSRVLPADSSAIAEAARIIRRGGLVAFPTETVYGLGANALDGEAAGRIFTAKGRPADDPLIVHVASSAQVGRVAETDTRWLRPLMERFWPGPLTLVLRRRPVVPDVVTAGGDTVAVRVPAHPVAQALIRAARLPIAAPSANLFAHPSPTTAQHVLDDLGDRIDLILDGGPTEVGVESTVLDLTADPPTVLRPGGVTIERLRDLLPDVAVRGWAGQDTRSPGTAERHYSPRARVDLFDGATPEQLGRHVRELELRGERVCRLELDADPDRAAQQLYAGLRALDATGPDTIVARLPPEGGLATALRDRLRRAASGRILPPPT